MQILHPESSDLDAIRRLLSALQLPHDDLTPSHLEHFLIWRDGSGIEGMVGVELYGDVGLLRSLAVSPEHRNEGAGARLTDEIERYARRQGVNSLYLLTTTAPKYFERRGYHVIERDALPKAIQETEEAARLCPSSAVCMRKRLGVSGEEEAR